MTTILHMSDPGGDTKQVTLPPSPTAAEVYEQCQSWVAAGDWGDEGACVDVQWELEVNGQLVDEGSEQIEIEPNHSELIRQATKYEEVCGHDVEDHDWTREGEGGCDENPGVWSTGGTTMLLREHCRRCGLSREEQLFGSQRNPGQQDTVEYRMLREEEVERMIKLGAMDVQED